MASPIPTCQRPWHDGLGHTPWSPHLRFRLVMLKQPCCSSLVLPWALSIAFAEATFIRVCLGTQTGRPLWIDRCMGRPTELDAHMCLFGEAQATEPTGSVIEVGLQLHQTHVFVCVITLFAFDQLPWMSWGTCCMWFCSVWRWMPHDKWAIDGRPRSCQESKILCWLWVTR